MSNRFTNCLRLYNQALSLRRAEGDGAGEAGSLTHIGVIYSGLGENQKALDFYNQVLPLWVALGVLRFPELFNLNLAAQSIVKISMSYR